MKENLIDYTYREGSISLEESPFNEVDALILSIVVYREFERLPSSGRGKTLKELYAPLCPLAIENNDTRLFKSVAATERLSSLIVDDFLSSLSKEYKSEEQFASLSLSLDGNIGYVIFRGTDSSLTGWKEDLNMAFEDEIPSERKALEFLEKVSKRYKKLIIAGHSKGGTLALYSALKAERSVFDKIETIYTFDAPGLPDKTTEAPRWNDVIKKSLSFVPSSSLFGVMFNTIPSPKVVKADAIGVFQHDAFSWRVSGNSFVYERDISLISKLHGEALRLFFSSSTNEEREKVVAVIYKVLSSVKEENVFHIPLVIIEHLDLFNNEIASLTKEERDVVKKLLRTLRESRRKGYKALEEKIDGKKEEK